MYSKGLKTAASQEHVRGLSKTTIDIKFMCMSKGFKLFRG